MKLLFNRPITLTLNYNQTWMRASQKKFEDSTFGIEEFPMGWAIFVSHGRFGLGEELHNRIEIQIKALKEVDSGSKSQSEPRLSRSMVWSSGHLLSRIVSSGR
jgi:hypothetical protein